MQEVCVLVGLLDLDQFLKEFSKHLGVVDRRKLVAVVDDDVVRVCATACVSTLSSTNAAVRSIVLVPDQLT